MPTATDDLFHELALTLLPGIGPQLTRQLMSYGGAAKNVLLMPAGKLRRIPGVGDTTIKTLTGAERRNSLQDQAEASLKKAEKENVEHSSSTPASTSPAASSSLPDAPVVLYYQGTADLNAPKTIGIVGTRQATDYGREQTERIIKGLATAPATGGQRLGLRHRHYLPTASPCRKAWKPSA